MPIDRRYRLTDAAMQPHPHQASIGVEVSTACGSWRTLQNPITAAAVATSCVERSNC